MKLMPISSFRRDTLTLETYQGRETLAQAAAAVAAGRLRALAKQDETIPVIFATGASQLATLQALTSMPEIPWSQVVRFHMDDYINLPEDHPASFRRYPRENLTRRVAMRRLYEIDGSGADAGKNLPRVRRWSTMCNAQRQVLLGHLGREYMIQRFTPCLCGPARRRKL